MAAIVAEWTDRLWQDLQPTPGRLEQFPAHRTRHGHYADSADDAEHALRWAWHILSLSHRPRLSGRLLPLRYPHTGRGNCGNCRRARCGHRHRQRSDGACAWYRRRVFSDRDVPHVEYHSGVGRRSSASSSAILMSLWETHAPAGPLVKQMLYLLGTISLAVGSVVAVEYIFGRQQCCRGTAAGAHHALSGARNDVLAVCPGSGCRADLPGRHTRLASRRRGPVRHAAALQHHRRAQPRPWRTAHRHARPHHYAGAA